LDQRGTKRQEIGEMHNDEHRNKYNKNHRAKENDIEKACSTHMEKKNACRNLVGKLEGKAH
jgi:hypothetical protein